MVRAKFRVDSYETWLFSGREMRAIKMSPVSNGGEEQFFTFTLSGQLPLGTVTANAWQQFELGKEYYLDFTPAD